jgi:predicted MPP superfamily phosphohydrolase
MILWAFSIVLLFGLAFAGFAFLQTRQLTHYRIDLFFKTLPAAFDGYTVLHLSDLHFGPRDRRKARRLAALNTPPADLCVITGDLIETDEAIAPCVEAVRDLLSREGTFCVLGNHDYYRYSAWDAYRRKDITDKPNNTELFIRGLVRNGVGVLHNQSREIRRNGESIWLAGVDDPVTLRDDVYTAVSAIPEGAFRILLSHTPDVLKSLPSSGEGLVLSGHTHGGQVVLPLLGPILNHSSLKPGFVSGMIRRENTLLLVSNGFGVNRFFPFRFRCKPEAHTIHLRKI